MTERMEDQQQAEKFTLLQGARRPGIPMQAGSAPSDWRGPDFMVSLAIAAIREMRTGTLLSERELSSERAVLGGVLWIAIEEDGLDTRQKQGLETGCNGNGWQTLVFTGVLSFACGIAAAFLSDGMKL